MTAIDRQQIIEAVAEAISNHQGSFLLVPEQPTRPTPSQVRLAEAVVPVIMVAVLKPIREQHASHVRAEYDDPDCEDSACDHYDELDGRWWCPSRPVWVCRACDQGADARVLAPCRTVQLCDEIEAAAKGGE